MLATENPTPEQDAAARAKEASEQESLPYKWTQTISELDVTFAVPGNYKGKDLAVDLSKQKIKAGVRGQPPVLDERPDQAHPCDVGVVVVGLRAVDGPAGVEHALTPVVLQRRGGDAGRPCQLGDPHCIG